MEPQGQSHGPDWPSFHWWRAELSTKYSRPPSPFPASFETPRNRSQRGATEPPTEPAADGCGDKETEEDAHRLTWPICSGPHTSSVLHNGLHAEKQNRACNQRSKKTGRLEAKRQAWIPPSNPSKTGAIFHPPPYTNRCKETLFHAKTAHPKKLTTAF
ncbi:hypothetical protein EGW08_021817 [Elysia chlorotica]|uniref:Uncharacterized protein n=1 Tax=Elysia chlorotica TaxID=188477 RepID=A0A3S0Z6I4_ELYCH|nr:hypothetical protein EGW08_021817 [Elysia chlorotica]